MDTVHAYRRTLKSRIDFARTDDHTFAELLYLSFAEPSSARLSREWNMPEEKVVALLAASKTHAQQERPILGNRLYDREDIDRFAPYATIRVPSQAREASAYEPQLLESTSAPSSANVTAQRAARAPEPPGLKYRADIDGLRALAVAAVVFYHAKVPGFEGGYIGVDVFFVISGFLITQLLDTAATDSHARVLMQFYLRRARRLLPALFVMLAVSALVAVVLYLPTDLRNFGRSLAFAVALLGNFGAALNGGYFGPGERFTPLRHLWSIGVEEQFYLLYPLCLFLIAGYRKAPRSLLLAAMTLASLLLSFWAADRWPIQNYFMLPTRAWELLIGAVLAVTPRLFRGSARSRQILGALGLAGLLAVVWYARVIRFPGAATLAASVCTAMLIVGNSAGSTVISVA